MSSWPAVTRSPRSARMRLTLPSASEEIVTSSTAASVPTTSTARRMESWRTVSVCTALAAFSRLLACAVSDLEQPVTESPITATTANRYTCFMTVSITRTQTKNESTRVYDGCDEPCISDTADARRG